MSSWCIVCILADNRCSVKTPQPWWNRWSSRDDMQCLSQVQQVSSGTKYHGKWAACTCHHRFVTEVLHIVQDWEPTWIMVPVTIPQSLSVTVCCTSWFFCGAKWEKRCYTSSSECSIWKGYVPCSKDLHKIVAISKWCSMQDEGMLKNVVWKMFRCLMLPSRLGVLRLKQGGNFRIFLLLPARWIIIWQHWHVPLLTPMSSGGVSGCYLHI